MDNLNKHGKYTVNQHVHSPVVRSLRWLLSFLFFILITSVASAGFIGFSREIFAVEGLCVGAWFPLSLSDFWLSLAKHRERRVIALIGDWMLFKFLPILKCYDTQTETGSF